MNLPQDRKTISRKKMEGADNNSKKTKEESINLYK